MPELSPPLQPQHVANSCIGNSRILFHFATLFIFLLILAGCTGLIVPSTESKEIPSSSDHLIQNEFQVQGLSLQIMNWPLHLQQKLWLSFNSPCSWKMAGCTQIPQTGQQHSARRCDGPFLPDLGNAVGPSF